MTTQPVSLLLLDEPAVLGSGGYSDRVGTREVGRLNSPSATSIEGLPGILSGGEWNQPDARRIDQVDGDDLCPGRARGLIPCSFTEASGMLRIRMAFSQDVILLNRSLTRLGVSQYSGGIHLLRSERMC